jgi:hypothetical protein
MGAPNHDWFSLSKTALKERLASARRVYVWLLLAACVEEKVGCLVRVPKTSLGEAISEMPDDAQFRCAVQRTDLYIAGLLN